MKDKPTPLAIETVEDQVRALIRRLPVPDRAVFARWCADRAEQYAAKCEASASGAEYATRAAAHATDFAATSAAAELSAMHAVSASFGAVMAAVEVAMRGSGSFFDGARAEDAEWAKHLDKLVAMIGGDQ